MKKTAFCAFLLALVMLCPIALALEENVVVTLPTVEPITSPSETDAPYYGPDGLAGYYQEGDNATVDEQTPALTADEQARAETLLTAYQQGERPSQSILNITDNVTIGVYALNPTDYDGENVYVLLPGDPLTDDEILGIIDGYVQLGLAFQPDSLSYRNCARGGGINRTRFLLAKETSRKELLANLYRREEISLATPLSPLPCSGGTGSVTLRSDLYAGLTTFQFIPYRELSDEELLGFVVLQTSNTVSAAQYAQYERQARSELTRLLNAPLALELRDESMTISKSQNAALADTTVYRASFEARATDAPFPSYTIMVDPANGVCRWLYTTVDGSSLPYSDVKLDASDPQWTTLASQYVQSIREDSEAIQDVTLVEEAERSDIGFYLLMRVTMEDSGYYDLQIACQNTQVITVEYIFPAANADTGEDMSSQP